MNKKLNFMITVRIDGKLMDTAFAKNLSEAVDVTDTIVRGSADFKVYKNKPNKIQLTITRLK